MIEFKNIYFIRNGDILIDDVSFKINDNENWAVLGPNGSGKSTIFSMLMAYTIASRGSIKAFGIEFGKGNWKDVKSNIGIVSSTMDKFNDVLSRETVYEVVLSGLKNKIGIYERESDEERGITEDFLKAYDFSSYRNKHYGNLSAGEKKKTMILRSLISKPKLLILDEPCSSLDLYQREQVLNVLEGIKNTNLIYITHDISEISSNITHVLLLKSGKVLKSGRKKDILTDDNLKQLYNLDVNISYGRNGRPMIEIL
ncbi:MAG: ATP-binding cassette domain-containing protein [Peptoniphilus sp.]|nr:ATP-binding cassette domain-containing protein [Peptoniphilus sp.]